MKPGKHEVRFIEGHYEVWYVIDGRARFYCRAGSAYLARHIAACLNALAAYSSEAIERRGAVLGAEK